MIHPFIYPSIYSFFHPSIHSSKHSIIHPFIHPSIHPFMLFSRPYIICLRMRSNIYSENKKLSYNFTPLHSPTSLLRQLPRGESLQSPVHLGCSTAECCELQIWAIVVWVGRTVQECVKRKVVKICTSQQTFLEGYN